MKKILRRIKEQYSKWLHKRRCRAIERFKRTMEEAYPDGANLLRLTTYIPEVRDTFIIRGDLKAEGEVTALCLLPEYHDLERKQIEAMRGKYKKLKVFVFYDPEGNECVN